MNFFFNRKQRKKSKKIRKALKNLSLDEHISRAFEEDTDPELLMESYLDPIRDINGGGLVIAEDTLPAPVYYDDLEGPEEIVPIGQLSQGGIVSEGVANLLGQQSGRLISTEIRNEILCTPSQDNLVLIGQIQSHETIWEYLERQPSGTTMRNTENEQIVMQVLVEQNFIFNYMRRNSGVKLWWDNEYRQLYFLRNQPELAKGRVDSVSRPEAGKLTGLIIEKFEDPITRTLAAAGDGIEAIGQAALTFTGMMSDIMDTMDEAMFRWGPGGHPILTVKKEQTELTAKYPHICRKCKKDLEFSHTLTQAKKIKMTREQTIKMWKSPHVQFYCCNCYLDIVNRNKKFKILANAILTKFNMLSSEVPFPDIYKRYIQDIGEIVDEFIENEPI